MKLLTIRQYSERHGVTVSYVYRMIRQGLMKCEEIAGVKFIKEGTPLPTRSK